MPKVAKEVSHSTLHNWGHQNSDGARYQVTENATEKDKLSVHIGVWTQVHQLLTTSCPWRTAGSNISFHIPGKPHTEIIIYTANIWLPSGGHLDNRFILYKYIRLEFGTQSTSTRVCMAILSLVSGSPNTRCSARMLKVSSSCYKYNSKNPLSHLKDHSYQNRLRHLNFLTLEHQSKKRSHWYHLPLPVNTSVPLWYHV